MTEEDFLCRFVENIKECMGMIVAVPFLSCKHARFTLTPSSYVIVAIVMAFSSRTPLTVSNKISKIVCM
jgi:hypothetical protein